MMLTVTARKIFCIVLILASTCKLFAGLPFCNESQRGNPTTDANGWEKLNLSSTTIAGATVYYEESLKSKLPLFEKGYKQYLVEKDKSKAILTKKEVIISEINQILGTPDANTALQEEMVEFYCTFLTEQPGRFYLVMQETIKNFLRKGGKLPSFTYDETTDTAVYKPAFVSVRGSPLRDFEFVIPIGSKKTMQDDINHIFEGWGEVHGSGKIGVGIHEVVEATLVEHIEPGDPYWRWFTDGFANAITIELLKKYVSEESAQQFAADYGVDKYEDLKKEVNLQYWMFMNFCIKTPLEYERKVSEVRYAYATLEAQRLIENHDIDCVRKILDKVYSQESRTSYDLLRAIKDVTGEDMQQRFRRYQTFETRKGGMDKYSSLFHAAFHEEDYGQMLTNLLRRLELEDNQLSVTSLELRLNASTLLFKLGYEEAGDVAIYRFLGYLKRFAPQKSYDAFLEAFVLYSLKCDNPQKAENVAEELLKKNPDHLPALTVRMKLLADSGNLDEAKSIAKRILDLVNDTNSVYGKAASEVLATDQNQ